MAMAVRLRFTSHGCLPPFVESWRDRHGKLRVYFRRGKGSRIPLPEKIGSLDFINAYQAYAASTSSQVVSGAPEASSSGS
jgi:hypothetical protein